MEEQQILLSICIPTNGNVMWVMSVLDSIYSQNVDQNCFEVIVTDNGIDDNLEKALSKKKYANLHYERTNALGFMNIVNSLHLAKGLFCKLHNHRSCMLPGMLEELLSLVKQYSDEQPIIYCTNGVLHNTNEITEYKDFNTFICRISYWSSSMAGICMWQKDIPQLNQIVFNKMFPNTSILFEMRQQSKYVIWNRIYEKQLDGKGKGCYNLFHTFGVVYLDMLSELRMHNRITIETFLSVKSDLFKWLCELYYSIVVRKTDNSFDLKDIKQSMNVYFSSYQYFEMIFRAYVIKMPSRIISKISHLLSNVIRNKKIVESYSLSLKK